MLLYVAGHSFARKREEKKRHPVRHSRLPGLPDAVESDAVIKTEGPETTLEGERRHDGKTLAPSLALANQL